MKQQMNLQKKMKKVPYKIRWFLTFYLSFFSENQPIKNCVMVLQRELCKKIY